MTYGVLFYDLLMLGLPDMLCHGEAMLEAVIALLNGLVVAVPQELLGGTVLGHLLVESGVLEQLVDGAVSDLLGRWLDQLADGQKSLLKLLGALMGGLDPEIVVYLLATPSAGRCFLLSGLGDFGVPGASPSTTSSASVAGDGGGS